MKQLIRTWFPPLAFLALVGIAWQLAVRIFDVPMYVLPAPTDVWTAFGEVRSTLPEHIWTTMSEAVLGLALGAVSGVIVASIAWAWPLARRTLMPLIVASQAIPLVVFAPLLVLWFGFGLLPKVLFVGLTAFCPIVLATFQGLADTDSALIDILRSMGAKRRHLIRIALLPSAMSSFLSGLRIAATYAVSVAVLSEWIGASSGLGLLATRAQASFRVDRVLVATAIIIILSIALFVLVDLLARRLMPWRYASSKLK